MLHEGIAKTFIAQFICTQRSMSKCLGKLDFEVRPTKMSGTLAGMRAQFCCTNGVQKHRHAQLLHWVAVHTLDRGVAVGTFMLLLAVIPAVVLFAYIYGKDTTEKEPPKLLLSLFLLGALTTAGASIIEIATSSLLSMFLSPNSTIYQLIENFLLVAFVEELGKYLALRARTWNDPQFNYTYDAVVYAGRTRSAVGTRTCPRRRVYGFLLWAGQARRAPGRHGTVQDEPATGARGTGRHSRAVRLLP